MIHDKLFILASEITLLYQTMKPFYLQPNQIVLPNSCHMRMCKNIIN